MRALLFLCWAAAVRSCTNILVSPGASSTGAALVGDNDDSSRRHGLVTHFPRGSHPPGAQRDIYDFETGTYSGSIPQPAETFNTMCHGNEWGLVIAETTQGGIPYLASGNGTMLDYGSLIVVTLQRAKTAREAIDVMVDLTAKYGYSSTMEGFSITDGKESWYMELMGRGNFSKGIIYVALRVPEGYFTANANQARIQTFLPCDDADQCRMSPDVVSFAKERGLWNGTLTDTTFSFSDVYDPVDVEGARFCEARVWYIFSQLADPKDFDSEYYLSYVQGFNLTRRMPLWVRPKRPLTRGDLHTLLGSKYEGSWLDPAKDVGAGPENLPYRWNGLTWKNGGKTYVNERVIGTQYTAWHFVASVHPDVPPAMRAVLFFGADEHAWAPKIPIFGGASAVHRSYDDANCSSRLVCRKAAGLPGSMIEFSWESAFWVTSAVSRLIYGDYDRAAPVVRDARASYDAWAVKEMEAAFSAALPLYQKGETAKGEAVLNDLSVRAGAEATQRWTQLWATLMTSFQDGLTTSPDPTNTFCGCKKETPSYSDNWLTKVVNDTGDHYRLPSSSCKYIDPDGHCHNLMRKTEIPGVME